MSAYEAQAVEFLAKNGMVFKAALQGGSKAPPWAGEGSDHGDHYRVTIKRMWGFARSHGGYGPGSITFDFWNSISERGQPLTPYSVLACISGDIYCPETFAAFCSDYGYEEDSRKAEQTFKAADKFGRKLRAFFSDEEREELSEIQ